MALANYDRNQWKKIQEKTFTNWVNDRLRGNLKVAKRQVASLETDLADGVLLIDLLDKLAHPKSVGRYNKNPRQKLHHLENLGSALKFIYSQKIKLVNIGPEDINGGNLKLILGLIWTLIKNYQIGTTGKVSTKKAMLAWINSIIPKYEIKNFTTDWNSGRPLLGVIDYIRPGACPNHFALNPNNGLENCKLAIDLADSLLEIPRLIDPEDMSNPNLDELSMMTYISYFCAPTNAILLEWIRKKIPNNNIKNLSTDWNNGINLGALGEACFEDLCPNWKELEATNAIENNKLLLRLMNERLGLVCPLSPEELADPKIDELLVATYLSQFKNAKLHASPEEFGLRMPSLSGSALIKQPVTFDVELSGQVASKLVDSIRVTAHGPSGDVKVNLEPKDNSTLEATFIPTEAGTYDIMAVYQDEHISGSPFKLPVADPYKCVIFGDIPSDMQVGKPESFSVKTREAGVGNLDCTIEENVRFSEGETPLISVDINEQDNDQFEVTLTPHLVGRANIRLKWANRDIPRNPFDVNICDSSKISISGIEGEGKVGEPVNFQAKMKEKDCGMGQLAVIPRGPSTNYDADVMQTGDGVYDVSFMPWEVGPHKIDVQYGSSPVPKSPFSMNIVAAPDASTCSASGKGLKKAVAEEDTIFQILAPESGLLTKDPPQMTVTILTLDRVHEAKIDIIDNADNTYTVQYNAPTPGDYRIVIKAYGKMILGSPFDLEVVPSAKAEKCRAYGPALHPNSLHIAGNPLDMFVDSKEGGTGDLRVIIVGPDEIKPRVFIATDEGIFSIKWDAPQAGRYYAHVWWEEQYIPGSPFKIKVTAGPNAAMVKAYGPGLTPSILIGTDPSDFKIETKDAGIGTLTLRVHGRKGAFKIKAEPLTGGDPRNLHATYNPKQGGDYIIAIRWSGTHVPGSPFKINIREPDKPEKSKKVKKEKTPKKKEKKVKPKPKPKPDDDLEFTDEEYTDEEYEDDEYYDDDEEYEEDEEYEDDDGPEPTPLSEVAKKRNKTPVIEEEEEEDYEEEDDANVKVSSDAAIRERQMALLKAKGGVGVDGGAVAVAPGTTLVASVGATNVMTQVQQVTHTSTEHRRVSVEKKSSVGQVKKVNKKVVVKKKKKL